MQRRALVASTLSLTLTIAACSELAGGPTVTEIVVQAAGMLIGDSAQAHASATKSNGQTIPDLKPDAWRSSNTSVISIDNNGVMKALAAGQATIFADYQGKTGSVVVTVGAGDARLGYALADQQSATSPYSPAASTRFNSSGGAITVTRANVGQYAVTFAGLGRPPGGHDNVQVTGYAGGAVYCKAASWDASGTDLVVSVRCVRKDASFADSKFTILAVGARAFGASTPIGFLLSAGVEAVHLDTAATARNSANGSINVGHVITGEYSAGFDGLGAQSGGAAGPVGIIVSGATTTARRCQADGYDFVAGQVGVNCRDAGGGVGDTGFSLLWFTRGRPGFRYGYALALGQGNTAGYAPASAFSANSSAGAITAKKTGTGTYQIVFAKLAHASGATEAVQVSVFGAGGVFCTIASWGNSGVNDLTANVTCWDTFDNPADAAFSILIVE